LSLAQAQESVNSSGSNASGSNGSAAYSIGQIVYNTYANSSGIVEQGVQHGFEIFTLDVKETSLEISLTAFPNPTAVYLTLQVNNYNKEKLLYHLYDLQGKLLNSGQINEMYTQINTSSLVSATYLISIVNQQNIKVQSFKIIKN
jgi:hypothetical protein